VGPFGRHFQERTLSFLHRRPSPAALETNRLALANCFTNRIARLIEADPTAIAVVSVADSHNECGALTLRTGRPWFFVHCKTSLPNESTETVPRETRNFAAKTFSGTHRMKKPKFGEKTWS
jgi:hypothetical protein